MKKLAALLIVVSLIAFGCAARNVGTNIAVSLEKEQAKNVDEVRDIKKSMADTCGYDTGFVRGLYGKQYEYYVSKYSQEANTAEDVLCKKLEGNKWQENQDLGLLVGGKLQSEFYSSRDVLNRIVKSLPSGWTFTTTLRRMLGF